MNPLSGTGFNPRLDAELAPTRAPEPPPQAPADAGKPNELRQATETLLKHYDRVIEGRSFLDRLAADGDRINRRDLERLLANPDPSIPQELRDAAQFLLDSEVSRNFLDLGAGKGRVDGNISREDLQRALETIDSGAYYDELLDTAAGRGGWLFGDARDGKISKDDIEAALKDPKVPAEVKDTLRLLLLGDKNAEGAGEILRSLSAEGYAAASRLYRSPEFAALSESDRRLITDTFYDSKGDPKVTADMAALIADPAFQALTPEQKTAKLTEFALVNSSEFKALSKSDQQLVLDALKNRKLDDLKVAETIKSLIEDGKFNELSAEEKTAVLSQVKNYPDSRAIANLERLVQKDWFQDFDLADTQRAAKMVAFLSRHDAGDRTVIDNTLNKFLAENAPYEFDFNRTGGAYGSAGGSEFHLNRRYMDDGNGPVDTSDDDTLHMTTHTFAHEVNHLVNGDKVAKTFEYFEEEYRGFYVGFVAQHGREPTAAEVIGRVRHLLTSTSGAYNNIRQALQNGGAESDEIVEFMKDLLGRDDVTKDNVIRLIDEMTAAGDTRLNAAAVRPSGNLDSH